MNQATGGQNPYPGPRPFDRHEEHLFFGREREVQDLVSLCYAHRILFLYAPSGSGKTSLLNAGVIPALEDDEFEVLPVVRVNRPLSETEQSAANIYVANTLSLWKKDEANDTASISELLRQREHQRDEDDEKMPRVGIFDQFEEFFWDPGNWRARQEFFRQIATSLVEDPFLRVIFLIREDYLAHLDPYTDLLHTELPTHYRLDRLRRNAAREAIERPAREMGRSFEPPGVVDELVDNLLRIRIRDDTGGIVEESGEFVEPVQLQIVCQDLWDRLSPDVKTITSRDVGELVDVDQALTLFYDRAVKKVAQDMKIKEDDLRAWFDDYLITQDETRGIVVRQSPEEDAAGMPSTVVDELVGEHVIRAEARGASGQLYELAHDRWITPIRKANTDSRKRRIEEENRRKEEQRLKEKRREALARKRLVRFVVGAVCIATIMAVLFCLYLVQYWKAERHFAAALDAVGTFFIDVSENRLLNEPGLQPLQKELLTDAQKYYKDFLEQRGDDSKLQREVALAHYNIGIVNEKLGESEAALNDYNRAQQVLEKLLDNHPDDPELLELLSKTLNAIGRVQDRSLGDTDEALRWYELAKNIREQLVLLAPSKSEFQRLLANSWMNLGKVNMYLQNDNLARTQLYKAQSVRSSALKDTSDDDETAFRLRRDLSVGYLILGQLGLFAGDGTASENLEFAELELDRLLDDRPNDMEYQRLLVQTYQLLGDYQKKEQAFEAAISAYETAIVLSEKLAARNPDIPDYLGDLATFHLLTGDVRQLQERPADALAAFEKARDVLKPLVQNTGQAPGYDIRTDYAVSLRAIADMQYELKQVEQAQDTQKELDDFIGGVAEKGDLQYELALADLDLGDSWLQQNNLQAALSAYVRASETLKALDSEFENTEYRSYFITALESVADCLAELLKQSPNNIQFKQHLDAINATLEQINN